MENLTPSTSFDSKELAEWPIPESDSLLPVVYTRFGAILSVEEVAAIFIL